MEASGAADIDELKAALIDPANYTHPFEMNDAFCRAETSSCRFTYLPPGQCKLVGVVFTTDAARPTVESILLQQIGADVIFAAPEELLYDTSIPGWAGSDSLLKLAMRFCHHSGSIFLRNETLEGPISFLGQIDELYVVAADMRRQDRWDLCLSDSIEELLWKAIDLKIPVHYYSCDGGGLSNPETRLEKRGVPDRVAAKDKERRECTSELTVVRVDCDWGSSGLWGEEGKMISYDYIDLPLPLIRRIIDWHKEFDATLDEVLSEAGPGDEWEERHEREKIEIALEVQNTLGVGIVVQIKTEQGWTPITAVTIL